MNRFRSYTGIAALAFLLMSTSGWAQTDLGKRVSIDVNTVSPQEVFGLLARSLDCEISVDPQVHQPVTLRLVDVTARTALSAICESIGCRYRLDGKKLVIEPPQQKAKAAVLPSRIKGEQLQQYFKKPLPQGLRFENAPLSSVLEAISSASGVEITVEPIQPERRVTVDVSGQTFQEALRQILTSVSADSLVYLGAIDGSKLKIKLMVRAKK